MDRDGGALAAAPPRSRDRRAHQRGGLEAPRRVALLVRQLEPPELVPDLIVRQPLRVDERQVASHPPPL